MLTRTEMAKKLYELNVELAWAEDNRSEYDAEDVLEYVLLVEDGARAIGFGVPELNAINDMAHEEVKNVK